MLSRYSVHVIPSVNCNYLYQNAMNMYMTCAIMYLNVLGVTCIELLLLLFFASLVFPTHITLDYYPCNVLSP